MKKLCKLEVRLEHDDAMRELTSEEMGGVAGGEDPGIRSCRKPTTAADLEYISRSKRGGWSDRAIAYFFYSR